MRPRRPAPFAVIAALLAPILLLAACSEKGGKAARTDTRPNIVVVMTDDQTLAEMQTLPKVRQLLGEEGTTFRNAFVSFPLCCPSRASYLTGQYAHNHGVQNNVPPLKDGQGPPGGNDALDHTNTLPVWLQQSGYNTAHVGKYLNGYGETSDPVVPPGYSRWFGLIDPSVLNFWGFEALDGTERVVYGDRDEDYQTTVLGDRATRDIRDFAAQDKPFYLTVWTVAPHSGTGRGVRNPLSPAPEPRYEGRYAGRGWPRPQSFMETDLTDKPPAVQAMRGKIDEGLASLGLTDLDLDAFIDETWQARQESLLSVDDMVERIITTLRETGQLDNTIVVFTSDNGWMLGEHGIPFAKVVLYEESIRVPLLVRGPGFPAGTEVTQPVANIDLAPTLVAAAKATPGLDVDGIDIRPFVTDTQAGRSRAILLEEFSHRPTYQAVRAPGFMYARYSDGSIEFYDLFKDPHQLSSKADDPAYVQVRARLAKALADLESCAGASCRVDVPGASAVTAPG